MLIAIALDRFDGLRRGERHPGCVLRGRLRAVELLGLIANACDVGRRAEERLADRERELGALERNGRLRQLVHQLTQSRYRHRLLLVVSMRMACLGIQSGCAPAVRRVWPEASAKSRNGSDRRSCDSVTRKPASI